MFGFFCIWNHLSLKAEALNPMAEKKPKGEIDSGSVSRASAQPTGFCKYVGGMGFRCNGKSRDVTEHTVIMFVILHNGRDRKDSTMSKLFFIAITVSAAITGAAALAANNGTEANLASAAVTQPNDNIDCTKQVWPNIMAECLDHVSESMDVRSARVIKM